MKSNARKSIFILLVLAAVLLVSACKKTEPPQYLPSPEPAPPPEMKWDVQVDFDALTPFVPIHSLHTRLLEGPMPELVPSNNYGMLLPYSSAVIMENGSLRASKFGFVTAGGTVITDLIYDGIVRAETRNDWSTYTGTAIEALPAYSLYIDSSEARANAWVYVERKMAVCALDGSWVTPFDYINIVYTEKVILLAKDHSTLDVDVIDYNGNHIYNMLDREWVNNVIDESWAVSSFMWNIAEGYGHIRLKNNTIAFIDVQTGNAYYTDFVEAQTFNEGLAGVAVSINNISTDNKIWGFINTDFEIVIPPMYEWPSQFINGRATVQDYLHRTPQQVINRQGDVLFTAPDGYSIEHSHEGSGFTLYSRSEDDYHTIFLTDDFEKLTFSEENKSFESNHIRDLGNGWFTTSNEFGLLLMNEGVEYLFPGVANIRYFDGEHMVFFKSHSDGHGHYFSSGVMTLDGREVIPPETGIAINQVTKKGKMIAFIVGTGSNFYFHGQEYDPNTYRLIDTNGDMIIQVSGVLTYYENLELYSIQSANFFSWLDINANPIITIPLLSSTFD